MSIWVTIPSAKPQGEALAWAQRWGAMGYRVAMWRDQSDGMESESHADLILVGQYQGYAVSCNTLIREVMARDPKAEWLICAGDDIDPDQVINAGDIGVQCSNHFVGTFGVMQPTGDRWGEHPGLGPTSTAYIDRVAGSAWYGREYCEQMYGGNGPLFHGYRHMFVDEEAKAVAEKMGVYWMRPDLTQFHHHWQRKPNPVMPHYLQYVNSQAHWKEAKGMFESRKAQGFPGHEPIPCHAL